MGDNRVDKKAIDRNVDLLAAVIATFPRRVPLVKALVKAVRRLATECSVATDVKAEAKKLRSMMAFVRRRKKMYGAGARPA